MSFLQSSTGDAVKKDGLPNEPLLEQKETGHHGFVFCSMPVRVLSVYILLMILCAITPYWWATWAMATVPMMLPSIKKPRVYKIYALVLVVIWGLWLTMLVLLVVMIASAPDLLHLPEAKRPEAFAHVLLTALAWGPVVLVSWVLSFLLFGQNAHLDSGNPWVLRKLFVRVAWDPPVLIASYLCDMCIQPLVKGGAFFDDGIGGVMISDISSDFCMGGRPLAKHVPELAQHGVHSVINMTREWPGPVKAYKQAGIEQVKMNVFDFSPPSLEVLKQGVEFSRRRLKEKGGGRIYIHCKGGIARASAMMLCCLLTFEQGGDIEERMKEMKKIRPGVVTYVKDYPSVRAFIADTLKDGTQNAQSSECCVA